MSARGTGERVAAKGDGVPAAAPRRSLAVALVRSFRLHQWAKNLLIFVPLILAGKLLDLQAWTASLLGFLAFGVLASSTYIINDLRDVHHDRGHWSKHTRPVANGDLPVTVARLAAAAGVIVALAIAAAADRGTVVILVIYGAVTLAYSLWLKRIPLADVLILAILFTIRLILGIHLADVAPSPWLLVFSMFIFTSLSLAKRFTELQRAKLLGRDIVRGRGYVAKDVPLLFGLGLASAVGAIMIIVVYLVDDAFRASFYKSPLLLWALPPILFMWLGRIWLLAGRDKLDDDPVMFAVRDRISLLLGTMMVAAYLGAWQI